MGRQAHRLRRPRPAVGNQVLHPQLPPRRRAQGPQPAHRPRPLRKDQPRRGQAYRRGDARAHRRRRGPRRGAREGARHAHPARGLRGVPRRRSRAKGRHDRGLPQELPPPSRLLAGASPGHYRGQGCRAVLQPPHCRGRMGPGQQRRQDAGLPLPAPVHRYRGSARSCRPVARDGRASPPPAQPAHPAAGRGAALLAPGHRDRRAQPRRARRLPFRPLHRDAPRRGSGAALGAGGHERDDVQGRGDRDRRAAGGYPSPGRRGRSSNAASPSAVAFPGSAGCGCFRPRAAPLAVSTGCST